MFGERSSVVKELQRLDELEKVKSRNGTGRNPLYRSWMKAVKLKEAGDETVLADYRNKGSLRLVRGPKGQPYYQTLKQITTAKWRT